MPNMTICGVVTVRPRETALDFLRMLPFMGVLVFAEILQHLFVMMMVMLMIVIMRVVMMFVECPDPWS